VQLCPDKLGDDGGALAPEDQARMAGEATTRFRQPGERLARVEPARRDFLIG
jgi:hypothetical protein